MTKKIVLINWIIFCRCFCDVDFFMDKYLPYYCNMFQNAKGYFWFYIPPFFLTLLVFGIVTIYIICVIYQHQQEMNQNIVVPFQQVSTIENQSHSLQHRSRIQDRIVQMNNWIQESQTLETAKRMLSINISTLCMLLIMLPLNVVLCYIYISGMTCQEQPIFISAIEVCGIIIPITFLIYIALAEKKLQKLSQFNPN